MVVGPPHVTSYAGLDVVGSIPGSYLPRGRYREDKVFAARLPTTAFAAPRYLVSRPNRLDSLQAELAEYNAPQPLLTAAADSALRSAEVTAVQVLLNAWNISDPSRTLQICEPQDVAARLDGSTSAGFPWNLKYTSKNQLLSSDGAEEFWAVAEAFFDDLPGLAAASDPNVVASVWHAFLKEELRSVEKLSASPPKIRSISGCPLELTLACGMLCLPFNEWFYSAHSLLPSAVGMSPFWGGWHRLYHHLVGGRRRWLACIDVRKWDRRFYTRLKVAVRNLRVAMMRLKGDALYASFEAHLRGLYTFLYRGHVAVPDAQMRHIVVITIGMLSGWPNTTVDNTLGHLIEWLCLLTTHNLLPLLGDGVVFKIYGDDIIVAACDEVKAVLTPATITAHYESRGWSTHPFDWLPVGHPDVEFLGGRFHADPVSGMVAYAPLDPAKGVDSMRFKGTGDVNSAFTRACALRLLHFFNPDACALATGYAQELLPLVDPALRTNYLTDDSIRRVHFGFEGEERPDAALKGQLSSVVRSLTAGFTFS